MKIIDFNENMLIGNGGGRRDRTDDLLLAKQSLSQLSYAPNCAHKEPPAHIKCMVGLGRLELPTSRLSGVRSNHLSYRPPDRSLVRPALRDVPRKLYVKA